MSNVLDVKNQNNYKLKLERNVQKVLGWGGEDLKVLKKSAGLLKGILKKSSVSYQRELRKEFNRK